MSLSKWWEAPEYDKRAPMDFSDRRGERQVTVAKDVRFCDDQRRWVSTPIKVYVGPSHI